LRFPASDGGRALNRRVELVAAGRPRRQRGYALPAFRPPPDSG